jgi:hypothetical protein
MAEVFVSFDDPVSDDLGTFRARAVGRLRSDRMWEGWVEFVPIDGRGDVLVTDAETSQPERELLAYWATGLTHVFLEGALRRARNPVKVRVRVAEQPASKAPRPAVVRVSAAQPSEAILDPFAIGSRSSEILRQELSALNRPRLLEIIRAYDLNATQQDLDPMSDPQLVWFIVVAVDARLSRRAR